MSKSINFEKSLATLETIVQKMEKGELSLEEALKQYENGMTLVKTCQETLTQAQQRIQLVVESNKIITTTDFEDSSG